MTKAQISAMPDVEVRLRLENVLLRTKIVTMEIRGLDLRLNGLSHLVRKKNWLRIQEKKWRLELDRRERKS